MFTYAQEVLSFIQFIVNLVNERHLKIETGTTAENDYVVNASTARILVSL